MEAGVLVLLLLLLEEEEEEEVLDRVVGLSTGDSECTGAAGLLLLFLFLFLFLFLVLLEGFVDREEEGAVVTRGVGFSRAGSSSSSSSASFSIAKGFAVITGDCEKQRNKTTNRKEKRRRTIHADGFERVDVCNIGKAGGLWRRLQLIQKRVVLRRR